MQMKPKIANSRRSEGDDHSDAAMNLVLQIEQQAEKTCGPGSDTDRALLLSAQGRSGVEQ